MNVALVLLADLLMPAPLVAGMVGLLQPQSAFPFLLLAIAAGMGLFLLFFQSWTLVLHSVLSTEVPPPSATRREIPVHGSAHDHPTTNVSREAGSV